MELKDITTAELVEELSKRDGVVRNDVEPYVDATVKVNGPAVVLIVID